MTTREAAACEFAEAIRARFEIGPAFFPEHAWVLWIGANNGKGESAEQWIIPAPDAPLHKHLAFVGRVAEACGFNDVGVEIENFPEPRSIVTFNGRERGASDLSWAALLAATAARKEGK